MKSIQLTPDDLVVKSLKQGLSPFCFPVQAFLLLFLLVFCLFTCVGDFSSLKIDLTSHVSSNSHNDILKLDLNGAGVGEFSQVPGIGKSIAVEIVSYRKSVGRFKNVEEIEKIKGIGQKTAEKIRPFLFVSDSLFIAPKNLIPSSEIISKPELINKFKIDQEKLDPNLASIEELKKLPGIGDVLAKRIVEKRKEMPFRNENDLQKVSGIGKKTSAKIIPFLKFPLISQ